MQIDYKHLWVRFNELCDKLIVWIFIALACVALYMLSWLDIENQKTITKEAIKELQQEQHYQK